MGKDALLPHAFSSSKPSNGRRLLSNPYATGWLHAAALAMLLWLASRWWLHARGPDAALESAGQYSSHVDPVLVSYSYFEKDPIQKSNMEFFMAVGMGIYSKLPGPQATDFVVVVSGEVCSPCKTLMPLLKPVAASGLQSHISAAWTGNGLTILQRKENEGMDIAAHNVTLDWVAAQPGGTQRYTHFIFLNSSVRGPFLPGYMPQGWQWTHAFTSRLSETVKLVSSSLVCLPAVDLGGAGPKAESWAFGVDRQGLEVLSEAGVFGLRNCKLCSDGIVVLGEYGLSNVLLSHGYNIATLMARYAEGTDWRDDKHWSCNDNVHPSRSGTYDDITMHPFETVFVKASWHVGEPFTSHYTSWYLGHALGQDNTAGKFDERLYKYGISMQAQEPGDKEMCYKIPFPP